MKGGNGRKKPIHASTWRCYLSAEFHRHLDAGRLKTWDKTLDESERPNLFADWPDQYPLMEQVVAEVWED